MPTMVRVRGRGRVRVRVRVRQCTVPTMVVRAISARCSAGSSLTLGGVKDRLRLRLGRRLRLRLRLR